jgi:hypothetical protein
VALAGGRHDILGRSEMGGAWGETL